MFFKERIVSIKASDRVLEIGPGANPHPRADVFLEKRFSREEALVQSGYSEPAMLNKEVVFYDGGRFPFKDKEFDYIICSHVIEHIPVEELGFFISELERVGKGGYIEFPNIFYELVNYEPVHIWFMNYRDKMLFLDKSCFQSNMVHKTIRAMFYGNDDYMRRIFKRHKEFFFFGFEWKGKIDYEIVNSYDELVNENDFHFWDSYFKSYVPPALPAPGLRQRLINKLGFK